MAEILCFVLKCFRSAVRGTDLTKPQNFPFFKLSNYWLADWLTNLTGQQTNQLAKKLHVAKSLRNFM